MKQPTKAALRKQIDKLEAHNRALITENEGLKREMQADRARHGRADRLLGELQRRRAESGPIPAGGIVSPGLDAEFDAMLADKSMQIA